MLIIKIIVTAVKERKYSMSIMKKVGLSVLVMFGIIGVIEGLSGSPSHKEQAIDIDKQDVDGNTQLHRAVWKKDIEAARILINRGANLNIQNGSSHETPLYIAVSIRDIEMVKLLIDAKADLNIGDYAKRTPLHKAIYREYIEIVKLLIDAKADVNENKYGKTPLHEAIYIKNIDMVKLLIAANADVNIQNGIKNTPLHDAVCWNNIDMVKLLIAANADVSIQNEYGETPLLHILRVNYRDFNFSDFDFNVIEIIKLLINTKADVNVQVANLSNREYDNGKTALHFAVKRNNVEAVKLLLAAKADKNIQDGLGKTALDYAGTQEMKEILRRK